MKSHRLIDQRSLAFDRLIASRLRENPALVQKAHANLKRWLKTASPGARQTLREWQSVLDGPLEALLAVLESDDERATRLRQSSPFCGVLSAAERLDLLKQFQQHDARTA